jgi:predicted nucleic acid-binding protein
MQKSTCDPKVKDFAARVPLEDMCISAISIGEICFGLEKLPPGTKKHELSLWLYAQLPEWFKNRVISLDSEVLIEWGRIRARADRTIPALDALIAAAAISRRCILITRNTKDFEGIAGLELLNPWEG